MTEFHLAVSSGNYFHVVSLLPSSNIEETSTQPSTHGWDALHFACHANDLEMVKLLLRHNKQLNLSHLIFSTDHKKINCFLDKILDHQLLMKKLTGDPNFTDTLVVLQAFYQSLLE